MPTYSDVISRSDVGALIPEDVSREIWQAMPGESAALALFRHVRMSRAQQRMPVLSALPLAYFVNGDTGLKQTTDIGWDNVYLNVEEEAVLVPIPEAVLDDAGFDVWGEIKPRLVEAIGRTLDAAIFFGTNKPASWPTAIAVAAAAASNVVVRGTSTQAQGGIMGDLSAAFTKVEEDGFDVSMIVANRTWKGLIRNVRDTTGQKLLDSIGVDFTYPMRGMFPTGASATEVILGDRSQAVIGIRQDITWKILDQAVIQDAAGAIVFNLAQQDMVALRVTFRVAWAVPNPINYDNSNAATRYPFAIVNAPA